MPRRRRLPPFAAPPFKAQGKQERYADFAAPPFKADGRRKSLPPFAAPPFKAGGRRTIEDILGKREPMAYATRPGQRLTAAEREMLKRSKRRGGPNRRYS